MKGRAGGNVLGATPGDVLIFLATLSLAAALLYPSWSARTFRERVSTATADVERLGTAARATLERTGQWPAPSAPGSAPTELAGDPALDSVFSREGYAVAWTLWRVVDSVEAPVVPDPLEVDAPPESAGPVYDPVVRSLGAIAIHSGEEALLAEVRERHSERTSFVLDTTLLILFPARRTP